MKKYIFILVFSILFSIFLGNKANAYIGTGLSIEREKKVEILFDNFIKKIYKKKYSDKKRIKLLKKIEKKLLNIKKGNNGYKLKLINFLIFLIDKEILNDKNNFKWIMKDVGLYTPIEDLIKLKKGGIDVITTEWGIGEDKDNFIFGFLKNCYEANLFVIMDGGFSAEAWGYDWDNYENLQKPVWQKEKVQKWINKIKDYPSVYAYDIANEFGENLPIPQEHPEEATAWIDNYSIKKDKLKLVKSDILEIDNSKPFMLRMRNWDLNDDDYRLGDFIEKDLTNILMLNLYTNWVYDGDDPDNDILITKKATNYINEIKKIDNSVEIFISLAAFDGMPYFGKPTKEKLEDDISNTLKLDNISGIGFFGLGRISDKNSDLNWYLFENGNDLWKTISKLIKK